MKLNTRIELNSTLSYSPSVHLSSRTHSQNMLACPSFTSGPSSCFNFTFNESERGGIQQSVGLLVLGEQEAAWRVEAK